MEQVERKHRERGTGSIFKMSGSRFWWIQYSRHGRPIRESSGSINDKDAGKLLKKRLAAITVGTYEPLKLEKIRIAELAEDLIQEYRVNHRKSTGHLEARWKLHLAPFFDVVFDKDGKSTGGMRASEVTTDLVRGYVAARQGQKAESATINRELSVLKRMFNLANECTPRKVKFVPHIPMLRESNTRSGFLESR